MPVSLCESNTELAGSLASSFIAKHPKGACLGGVGTCPDGRRLPLLGNAVPMNHGRRQLLVTNLKLPITKESLM